MYGPLVSEGAPLMASFNSADLEKMRDHLIAMRAITDSGRDRLRSQDGG